MASEDVLVYRCESEEQAEQLALSLALFPPGMGVRCTIEDEVLIVFGPLQILEAVADVIERAAASVGCDVERLERLEDDCDEDGPPAHGWVGTTTGEA